MCVCVYTLNHCVYICTPETNMILYIILQFKKKKKSKVSNSKSSQSHAMTLQVYLLKASMKLLKIEFPKVTQDSEPEWLWSRRKNPYSASSATNSNILSIMKNHWWVDTEYTPIRGSASCIVSWWLPPIPWPRLFNLLEPRFPQSVKSAWQ